MTEWNATAYVRLSNYMQSWGETIVESLPLNGDETVLDLGCGTGTLTRHLAAKLPNGHVIAIDRSANMVQSAREHLQPDFGDRVSYLQTSLDELDFFEVADLVFSNATFHWLPDHPKLFKVIYTSLKPGGWLIAQCGGGPNILKVRQRAQVLMDREPLTAYFKGWPGPWEFATPDVTAERLHKAGFEDVETSTFEAPVVRPSRQDARDYLENVILGTHLARIPTQHLREQFLDTLADQYGEDHPPYVFDYWRMNIRARKPGSR